MDSYRCSTVLGEGFGSPEEFMPERQMSRLLMTTLVEGGRIDRTGVVLPIAVDRRQYDPEKWAIGPELESRQRHDILVPGREHKRQISNDGSVEEVIKWTVKPYLYNALTGYGKLELDPQRFSEVITEAAALDETLRRSPMYSGLCSTDQLQDAYRIRGPESSREMPDTRIYVPVGQDAMRVVRRVVEEGAVFSSAKAWVPRIEQGEQEFRRDTPIFGVQTLEQLKSVVSVLRVLQAAGELPLMASSLVGMPITDLPGTYIGQAEHGASFNGRMRELFAGPLTTACQENQVAAGERITLDWLTHVGRRARDLATASAEATGTSTRHHALLKDQDPMFLRAVISEN